MKLRLSNKEDEARIIKMVGHALPFNFKSFEGAMQWFCSTHPKAREKKVEAINHFEKLMSAASALLK
jgi:hypothetical protein